MKILLLALVRRLDIAFRDAVPESPPGQDVGVFCDLLACCNFDGKCKKWRQQTKSRVTFFYFGLDLGWLFKLLLFFCWSLGR